MQDSQTGDIYLDDFENSGLDSDGYLQGGIEYSYQIDDDNSVSNTVTVSVEFHVARAVPTQLKQCLAESG